MDDFQTMCTAKIILCWFYWQIGELSFWLSFFPFLLGGVKNCRKYVVYQIYRLTWGFHFLTEAIHKKGNPFDKKLSRSHIVISKKKIEGEKKKLSWTSFGCVTLLRNALLKNKSIAWDKLKAELLSLLQNDGLLLLFPIKRLFWHVFNERQMFIRHQGWQAGPSFFT